MGVRRSATDISLSLDWLVAHPDLVEPLRALLLRRDDRIVLLRRLRNANNERGGEVPESSTLQTIAKHARRQHFDASPSVTGQ